MKRITFLGSGNVATNLAFKMKESGYTIVEIWSKSASSAKELSDKINSNWTTDLNNLKDTELLIIAIKDDFIEEIASKVKNKQTPIIHTSGGIGLDVFKNKSSFGVFYPLQSLNKNMICNFNDIPICIEANNKKLKDCLINIANKISQSVHLIDSSKRKQIHLAAVFASNFSNHMISISEKILKEIDLDPDLLKPLIHHTINKLDQNSANTTQTGPAIREDYQVIENHRKMIKDPDLKLIYSKITDHIINQK